MDTAHYVLEKTIGRSILSFVKDIGVRREKLASWAPDCKFHHSDNFSSATDSKFRRNRDIITTQQALDFYPWLDYNEHHVSKVRRKMPCQRI